MYNRYLPHGLDIQQSPPDSRSAHFQSGSEGIALDEQNRVIAVLLQVGHLLEKPTIDDRHDKIACRFPFDGDDTVEDEVPVHAGFSRNDTTLFVLHEGAEFTILDEEQGWWKITLADGKKGWVAAPSGGRVALTQDHPIAR